MPAHKPEECDLLIEQALKNKDLDAAVALYEPNASLVLDSVRSSRAERLFERPSRASWPSRRCISPGRSPPFKVVMGIWPCYGGRGARPIPGRMVNESRSLAIMSKSCVASQTGCGSL